MSLKATVNIECKYILSIKSHQQILSNFTTLPHIPNPVSLFDPNIDLCKVSSCDDSDEYLRSH